MMSARLFIPFLILFHGLTIARGATAETDVIDPLTTSPNQAPVATNDRYSVKPGSQTLAILSNDTDANGDPLSVTAVSDPAKGTVTINPDQTLTYTAQSGFTGTDSFTYTISDSFGGTASASVEIYNTLPTAAPLQLHAKVRETDKFVSIVPTISDPDPEQIRTLTVSQPAFGTAVVTNQSISYSPYPEFKGSDSFTYTVSDGFESVTKTVEVTDLPYLATGSYGGTSLETFEGNFYLTGATRISISRNGAFTAAIGPFIRVKGAFAPDGHYIDQVDTPIGILVVALQIDPATKAVVGRVGNSQGEGPFKYIEAALPKYSAKNPAPQAGRYTFLNLTNYVLPVGDNDQFHFGSGCGTMHVSDAGRVRCIGRLPDGKVWTAGAPIYGTNRCSLAKWLDYPGYDGGYLYAAFDFNNLAATDAAGELVWFRALYRPGAAPTGYKARSNFVASYFDPQAPLMLLTEPTHNAQIAYEGYPGGPFQATLGQVLTWSSNNRITRANDTDPKFNLQLDPTTGLFHGAFHLSPNKGTPFFGALFQKTNSAWGCYRVGIDSGFTAIHPYP